MTVSGAPLADRLIRIIRQPMFKGLFVDFNKTVERQDVMTRRIIRFLAAILIMGIVIGCEATDDFVEKATGKQSVDQFKKTMDDLDGIEKQQKQKYSDLQKDQEADSR